MEKPQEKDRGLDADGVRAAIMALLPEPRAFGDGDNLIECGLDSLRIMRLLGQWRRAGARVSFGDLLEKPTLRDWLTLLDAREAAPTTATPPGKEGPFPLTDVQYAYWIGRRDDQPLGGVGCHAYLEIDGENVDPDRLERAWDLLRRSHPLLRARFTEDGRQEIMEAPFPAGIVAHDLRAPGIDVAAALEATRTRLSHRRLPVEKGHVAGLEISLLPEGRTRVHFDVDLLVADAQSLGIILRDLNEAYALGSLPSVPANWSFAAWMERAARRGSETLDTDRAYWTERLPHLPGAPALPLRKKPETAGRPLFRRRTRLVPESRWRRLREKAASHGVTPAMVLLTVYAGVLARWSESPRFLITLPLYNRDAGDDGMGNTENAIADFTSLVLLEADFSGEAGFLERLRALQSQLYRDMEHAGYSGVRVLRDLARARSGASSGAPVVFAGNIGARPLPEEARPLGKTTYMITQTPQIWLDFQLYETEDGLLLAWDAVEDLFPSGMLDQMLSAYDGALSRLAAPGADWTAAIEPAPVLRGREGEDGGGLPETTLHAPFFAAAARTPVAPALLMSNGETLSYARLAEKALRLAGALRAIGVEDGDPVAVTLPRGPLQIAAVLGILAAGAAYVPISPEQPRARRERILRKARIRFVLTDTDLRERLPWPDGTTALDATSDGDAAPLAAPRPVPPESLAYVIFTSGSTGEPKGVEMTHAAAVNTVAALVRRHGLSPDDRGLAVSAVDFDLSVFDMFGLLGAGGALAVLDETARRDAAVWRRLVEEYRITIWNSVPILLDMLLTAAADRPSSLASLRVALLSGDWIGMDLPARLAAAAPACRFVALGGATEAAIWSNVQDVTLPLPATWTSIPYGRALPGQAYRVVDARGRDCPDWVPGELWIGGMGVARGYRGDPELTARAFVRHNGMRWYRTGDMGRFWPDGTLEFLGRRDFQVKVRGHRIELGEIEAAIRAFPGAREAAVIVFEAVRGIRRLRAFVVTEPGTPVDMAALRAFLRDRLPEYMVPSAISTLQELPLSANGKLDRQALTALPPPAGEDEATAGTPPATATEKKLAVIWKELLSVSELRREDSFFELGGDSLLATRLAAAIRKAFAVTLPLDALFLRPAFAEVASLVEETRLQHAREADDALALPELTPRRETLTAPFPLTDIQHAYWIGRTGAYELGNVSSHIFFEFDDLRLDLDRLREAWLRLVRRHDMLRAVFLPDGTQRIREENPASGFTVDDLRGRGARETEDALNALRNRMSTQTLPEETGPLFDIRAVRYDAPGGERVRLFLDVDALIADAWSLFLLLDEWLRLYRDPAAALPALTVSFPDYVLATEDLRASRAYADAWAYWNARLDDIPMPPDLPLAKHPSSLGSSRTKRRHLSLPAAQWDRLKSRIRASGLSPSGFLIAAYAEVLGMWSGSPRFTINLTLFNRLPLHPQVNDLVGDFTSLDLLVVDGGRGTFLEKARALQRRLWEDMNHRLVDGVQVVRELGKRGRRPAPAVVFTGAVGLGAARDASALAELGTLVASVTQTPQVCLDHQAYEQNGDLILNWDSVEELFPEGMLDAMFAAYGDLVRRLADGRGWDEEAFSALPAEQEARRAAYNATAVPLPPATLDGLFRQSARAFPGNAAVITPEGVHTYAELSARADAVAAALRGHGARRNRLVAVVLEKSWEQIAAVTGVIRAGAAYLPIDPAVPAERLRLLLRAGEVTVALTSASLRDALPWPENVTPLDVGALEEAATAPPPPTTPDDIAYVIYTSGSTGRPKGVVIDHRGVTNTVLDMNERFGVGPEDRIFSLSGLHFDLSAYDIWGALAAGAALVLPHPSGLRDPSHWLPLMRRRGATIWNSVPALLQMLTDYAADAPEAGGTPAAGALPETLRLFLLSGDWIPPELPATVHTHVPHAAIVSLGGATEGSIWSIFYPVERLDPAWKSIPYGYPLRNQRIHVLDAALRPRPDWAVGELFIGGDGVARGYWKDPERTSESFVTHPRSGERLYRTGDLGRFLPDGFVEFLGRRDFQVKIRGHRIELGEIEAVLRSHEAVSEAVAAVTGSGDTDRRLTAFAVARNGTREDELLDFARRHLPAYMVPAALLLLESLPLSGNGKIDRKALLRRAEDTGTPSAPAALPLSRAETIAAAIWKELLGRQAVGADDNFFDLGGTSVLAVRLHRRLTEAFGSTFPLVSVFEYPTVRAFAAFMDAGNDSGGNDGENGENNGADRISRRRARLGATACRNGRSGETSNARIPNNAQ